MIVVVVFPSAAIHFGFSHVSSRSSDDNSWVPHVNDNSGNHIHIQLIKNNGETQELAETGPRVIRTADGVVGGVWVDYDGTTLSVSHNAYGTAKPSSPILTVDVNLASFFSGKDVFVGFTGATWAEGDNQDIVSFKITQ